LIWYQIKRKNRSMQPLVILFSLLVVVYATSLPGVVPTAYASAASYNPFNVIYLTGGLKNGTTWDMNTPTNQFVAWEILNHRFATPLPNMNSPRAGHVSAFYADFLFVFGGSSNNQMERFNVLGSVQWEILSINGSIPPATIGASSVVSANKWYIFGGRNPQGTMLNDLWVFDFSNLSWTKLLQVNPPPARHFASLSFYNNQLVLVGGQSAFRVSFSDVWMFNFGTNQWVSQSSIPIARFGHIALIQGTKLYVTTGFTAEYGDVWQFDFSFNTWTVLHKEPHQPIPRSIFAAASAFVSMQGLFYLFGGYGYSGSFDSSSNPTFSFY
jgi:N-acetylneuraminic acid mutarotase